MFSSSVGLVGCCKVKHSTTSSESLESESFELDRNDVRGVQFVHDCTYHWKWCYRPGLETQALFRTSLSLSSTPPPASSSTSHPSASSTPPPSALPCGSLAPPATGCWESVVWKMDLTRKCSPGFPQTQGRSLGRTRKRCEWSDWRFPQQWRWQKAPYPGLSANRRGLQLQRRVCGSWRRSWSSQAPR